VGTTNTEFFSPVNNVICKTRADNTLFNLYISSASTSNLKKYFVSRMIDYGQMVSLIWFVDFSCVFTTLQVSPPVINISTIKIFNDTQMSDSLKCHRECHSSHTLISKFQQQNVSPSHSQKSY
jgi:hypothetical protein